jgi:putative transposase
VLDAFSRRVVRPVDQPQPAAALTCNPLGIAIEQRDATRGTVIHSDHGTQFTAWTFSERARKSGLLPSIGTVGDCYDNAMMEAFWSRTQVESLDSRRWKTRVELANAIFEYIEIFHNRRRRHSSLGMRTPNNINTTTQAA